MAGFGDADVAYDVEVNGARGAELGPVGPDDVTPDCAFDIML